MTPAQSRQKLRRIGQRRETLREQKEKLDKDTRKALKETAGTVPLTEAATLIGLHRATVYQNFR